MRWFPRIALCLPIIYSTSLAAQNSGIGGYESICSAHLYYAIGESKGEAKAKYQWAVKYYVEQGITLVGVEKFSQMSDEMKKVASALPEDTFWNMTKNCVEVAEARAKGK